MNYIYDQKDWPRMTCDHERLVSQLAGVRHRQGRLIGRMESLGFSLRNEAVLNTLTEDVLKSNEIEGEKLDIGSLVKRGVLVKKPGGGRSTSYALTVS